MTPNLSTNFEYKKIAGINTTITTVFAIGWYSLPTIFKKKVSFNACAIVYALITKKNAAVKRNNFSRSCGSTSNNLLAIDLILDPNPISITLYRKIPYIAHPSCTPPPPVRRSFLLHSTSHQELVSERIAS